jgi:hypothetical protein
LGVRSKAIDPIYTPCTGGKTEGSEETAKAWPSGTNVESVIDA